MAAQFWRSLSGEEAGNTGGDKDSRSRRRTPVLVEARRSRWRLRRRNPLGALVWIVALLAVLPPVLGILFTWASANPANVLVSVVMWSGGWLTAPFHAMFTDPDPGHQLMLNWGIAAGVYLVVGRTLARLLRW